ncbi:MAG: stage 0 sporulation family protein [Nitrospirota bacterium]
MPDVVGVRFRRCGKIYDFEVDPLDVKEGDPVIVESDFGLSIGTVVRPRRTVGASERELKKVIRRASEEDFKAREDNKRIERDARAFCLERIMARGLPMKLVGAEATLDRKRIVFYFTADGRIDFRELVKDLAAKFKTRIEMRQIGVRDEAKIVGGIGICGRELCCNTFLATFDPVSIKMAKKQELVLNVGKLSGLCSRLMCCLRYEYDGDLGNIASDDDIPIGGDDIPIEVIEEKITATPARREHPRRMHPRETKPARREPIREAAPEALVPTEAAPASAERAPEQQEKRRPGRHKRKRFRR